MTGESAADDESPLLSGPPSQPPSQPLGCSGSSRPPCGCSFGTAAGATLALAVMVLVAVDLPVRIEAVIFPAALPWWVDVRAYKPGWSDLSTVNFCRSQYPDPVTL
eukprot:COSAG02_NODE_795_length_17133_cov_6.577727_24_plen_106_part_00